MNRPLLISCVALLLCHGTVSGQDDAATQTIAKGIVFHDANKNGKFDEGEKPVPSVKVSNGKEIVATGKEGRFEIPVGDDTIIFVIKPRGWRTPLTKEKLPRFYYIHKPNGSPNLKYEGVKPTGPLPKLIEFPLYPQTEPDQFRAVMFGDPQPRNQKEVDYIAHDVVEELIGTDASFGVTLGDIMFDDLKLFKPLASAIALIGIPWFNVIGNHDINLDAKSDQHSDETFESVFGPSYYSFDYGPVHFLVLDDIQWYLPKPDGKGRYRGGLGKTQMEFIRNDLKMIPDDQLVVLMMHIPLIDVRDRHELYRLIEKRPFCMSISGHTHHHEHRFIKREDGWMGAEPHHHVINVTVSGSWWSGSPDERGIPHTMMADGAPNGYSIISFDGSKYTIDFKAAARPKSYQMNVHAPECVFVDDLANTTVYANVFNGSERSKVQMRVGKGKWITMEHSIELDPTFKATGEAEAAILARYKKDEQKPWTKLSNPKASPHLWRATLPAKLPGGVHLIHVRATDINGKVVNGRRTIRVKEEAAESEKSETK